MPNAILFSFDDDAGSTAVLFTRMAPTSVVAAA